MRREENNFSDNVRYLKTQLSMVDNEHKLNFYWEYKQ